MQSVTMGFGMNILEYLLADSVLPLAASTSPPQSYGLIDDTP